MQFKVHFRLWYVKGLIINLCCLKKIISKIEAAEICSLFIADYGLYPLYLRTTARYSVMQLKHTACVIVLGNMMYTAVYPEPWHNDACCISFSHTPQTSTFDVE
jgi:hypothetical protein